MKLSGIITGAALAAFGALVAFHAQPASAQTIVDEWSQVKPPAAPVLKPVKVDPKTTAFLVLDLVKQTCNEAHRPRCLASLPKVKAFLEQARAHGMPVIYSLVNGATTADIAKDVAPQGNEPVVTAHANKFVGTDLEKILKGLHVTTVIPVGATAEGAVLFTGSEAAFLGFKVIDPVDGSSASDLYPEQATAWILGTAPGVGTQTTLTSFSMMSW